ncbi:hypothetical protein LCL95_00905 [Bacillus timonensis]|nr:hypothetical protein [Bacillus timonensis]
MLIRSSVDIENFLKDFNRFASYDSTKEKHYFVFSDKRRGGQLTLMLKGVNWTVHGMGEGYCDIDETTLSAEECAKFVWFHRKAINQSLKECLVEC